MYGTVWSDDGYLMVVLLALAPSNLSYGHECPDEVLAGGDVARVAAADEVHPDRRPVPSLHLQRAAHRGRGGEVNCARHLQGQCRM